jgi:hypothetical protein
MKIKRNLAKIGIHQLHYQINIGKLAYRRLRRESVEQTYNLEIKKLQHKVKSLFLETEKNIKHTFLWLTIFISFISR